MASQTTNNALQHTSPNTRPNGTVYVNPIYNNTPTMVGNTGNTRKTTQCVKVEETTSQVCKNFSPLDQGNYGICWYASALHSILMSERIREVLVKNIAQMVINYINPEDKKGMLQEVLEPVVGGGLCFKINEYYTGTMKRFIRHLLIIFFHHIMSDEDKQKLKLNQKQECDWLYDFAKNGLKAKDKNLQAEQSQFLNKIATRRTNLAQMLETQINNKLPGKSIKVELWKYTDTPSMWRTILDRGGKSHFAVFPFLLYLFNFQGCLPIHITNYTIQNKQEMDIILDIINNFVHTDYVNNGFTKPEILSITCNISTTLSKNPDQVSVGAMFGQKQKPNAVNEPKQTEYITEYIENDYTLESANLYVEDDRNNGHVIAGIKCGEDKFILNSWSDKTAQIGIGKGTKVKENWLDTRVSIKDYYRDTLHTLNYVSNDNTGLKYASIEQDLYKLWKTYQIRDSDTLVGGSSTKMTEIEKKQFKQKLMKQTQYYLKKYNQTK
jgi:hypothetical protein